MISFAEYSLTQLTDCTQVTFNCGDFKTALEFAEYLHLHGYIGLDIIAGTQTNAGLVFINAPIRFFELNLRTLNKLHTQFMDCVLCPA